MSIEQRLQLAIRQLVIAQSAIETAMMFVAEVVQSQEVMKVCTHPEQFREDLTGMGETPGSHWRCKICNHEEDTR
jgi:hypothetical protein